MLVDGAIAHLRRKLLLSRGHLPLAASALHTARLVAIRLGLGGIDGFNDGNFTGGARPSVGFHDAHCAQGRLLEGVNDITLGSLNLTRCAIGLLKMFDGEVDDRAANLHGFVETWQKWCPLLHQHESTKLALVVLKKELSSLKLDFRVAS